MTAFAAHISALLLGAIALLSAGCNPCRGHDDLEHWCEDDSIWECRSDEGAVRINDCMPGGCQKSSCGALSCVVPGYTCPSGVTGYTCLGNRRISCEADGVAGDLGDCGELQCVENPGGDRLICGYLKERCYTPDEVRCLGEGSVVCSDSVWGHFLSNQEAGQETCDITYAPYCNDAASGEGATWCEGDDLLTCERCLDHGRCAKRTRLATCSPGACLDYVTRDFTRPLWMWENSIQRFAGCATDTAVCAPGEDMRCLGDIPAYCLPDGRALAGMTCTDVQRMWRNAYGPQCIPWNSRDFGAVTCAYSADSCLDGQRRCVASDAANASYDLCDNGVWRSRQTCAPGHVCAQLNGTTQCQ